MTSGNAPRKTHPQVELDYLAAEASAARAVVRASLAELKATLRAKIDPLELTREHPRVAVGLAATAGVTAGVVLCRVCRASPPAASTPVAGAPVALDDVAIAQAGWVRGALDKLFELGKAALLGAVGNALRLAIQSGVAIWTSAAARPEESAPVDFASVDLPSQNSPVTSSQETIITT